MQINQNSNIELLKRVNSVCNSNQGEHKREEINKSDYYYKK